jgi:hypothetical protein
MAATIAINAALGFDQTGGIQDDDGATVNNLFVSDLSGNAFDGDRVIGHCGLLPTIR